MLLEFLWNKFAYEVGVTLRIQRAVRPSFQMGNCHLRHAENYHFGPVYTILGHFRQFWTIATFQEDGQFRNLS